MSRFFPLFSQSLRNKRQLQRTQEKLELSVKKVNARASEFRDLANAELKKQFESVRLENRIDNESANDSSRFEVLITAAAIGCEAVHRIVGFRLHDVQIKGALATAGGSIIQMNTGEGKTMVCGLSALLRSVLDSSVHVATTNAYLAERDHEAVQPIFELLGTTSAFIGPESKPMEIRKAYRCNITYAPGYMFGFDYLRDQMLIRDYESVTLGRDVLAKIHGTNFADELSQTTHNCIIVDEADSVLIDESTTPLLLSGPGQAATESALQSYLKARKTSEQLELGKHYTVDESKKLIDLTDIGLDVVHEALEAYGRLKLCQPWSKYISNALYANQFLIRDEDYVVDEDQIKLVDQNTGRIFDDRSLRAGLHQALEAKEDLPINPPNSTMARVTRQRFFQLYDMVCGMTGTAVGSEAELKHFYDVDIVPLPPNKKCKRIQLPDRFFADWNSKLSAIVADVNNRRDNGQPILIGTRTIRESTLIESALTRKEIECSVLNGIQDESEAEIVAGAGQPGKITIATNMAGRGTDIKLTDESRAAGGLHVIGSQRFESRRVDGQLAGRAARQGDPGSCQFFIAADDQLIADHAPTLAKKMGRSAGPNGECKKDFTHEIIKLQAHIEETSFQQRCRLVKQEGWLDSVRETMVGQS
jgi:preprotein translocase subunit SecA